MIRRAVLPKSNTVTGVIWSVRGKHCFYSFGVFNVEFLEIGEFVGSKRIFLIVFSHVAFDSWCHIAKQMRNAGAWYEQALVSWSRKFRKRCEALSFGEAFRQFRGSTALMVANHAFDQF